MNGSNHLQEDDRKPLHLCPVCFRKLQLNIGFDIVAREQNIYSFVASYGFKEETAWQKERLEFVTGTKLTEQNTIGETS
jgi:archaemetzincin